MEGVHVAGAVGALRETLVVPRRAKTLASHLAALIPKRARILDVGCGDGAIATLLRDKLPGASVEGIDTLVWPEAKIPVRKFDGERIPFDDASFDIVMFVDVLHHAKNPIALLREARRVGGKLLIKDHFRQGFAAGITLRFMDWVGNAHHHVALPYNYWTPAEWDAAFEETGLKPVEMIRSLGLYPSPASLIFERHLHFIGLFDSKSET
jgi:SAM-dependent methyltransferase